MSSACSAGRGSRCAKWTLEKTAFSTTFLSWEQTCRCKVRMSGLCKVEMSAFMDGRGPHGNGANRVEPTRTGPIESVARGTAEAADAADSRGAAESKRPPRAADA